MADYIDRNKAINALEYNNKVFHYADSGKENIVLETVDKLCQVLCEIPAADVQLVKHGKWERLVSRQSGAHYEVGARCSCCNEYTVTICACEVMPFGFCPHCTADMRGDTNERS